MKQEKTAIVDSVKNKSCDLKKKDNWPLEWVFGRCQKTISTIHIKSFVINKIDRWVITREVQVL